jgi:hypothetical protein
MRAPSRTLFSLAVIAAVACGGRPSGPVAVRDPSYVVVRPIRPDSDPQHTIPVDLPMAGGGYGFATTQPLFDLSAFDLGRAEFAGGRTSIVGAASLWIPLKPEDRPILAQWVAHDGGLRLGIFLDGRLVAAPRVKDAIGGIFLPVPSKADGDRVLARLRNGGAPG